MARFQLFSLNFDWNFVIKAENLYLFHDELLEKRFLFLAQKLNFGNVTFVANLNIVNMAHLPGHYSASRPPTLHKK